MRMIHKIGLSIFLFLFISVSIFAFFSKEEIVSESLNIYSGDIEGKFKGKLLSNVSTEYSGAIEGEFRGDIRIGERSAEVNMQIREGTFKGILSGKYDKDNVFDGVINGYLSNGKVFGTYVLEEEVFSPDFVKESIFSNLKSIVVLIFIALAVLWWLFGRGIDLSPKITKEQAVRIGTEAILAEDFINPVLRDCILYPDSKPQFSKLWFTVEDPQRCFIYVKVKYTKDILRFVSNISPVNIKEIFDYAELSFDNNNIGFATRPRKKR